MYGNIGAWCYKGDTNSHEFVPMMTASASHLVTVPRNFRCVLFVRRTNCLKSEGLRDKPADLSLMPAAGKSVSAVSGTPCRRYT